MRWVAPQRGAPIASTRCFINDSFPNGSYLTSALSMTVDWEADSSVSRVGSFYTLWEARVLIERWRRYYNHRRPHSSLGYRPPAPEAITAVPPASVPLQPAELQWGNKTWEPTFVLV
jgi:transposase InsO family protein